MANVSLAPADGDASADDLIARVGAGVLVGGAPVAIRWIGTW